MSLLLTYERTVPGFEQLSKQQLFDISAKHILSTGVKSVQPGGSTCVFAGTGCAAAPFLKPEVRDELDKKGMAWDELVLAGYLPEHERELIFRLQCCHDQAPKGDSFLDYWREKMRGVADDFGLDPAEAERDDG